MNLFVGILLVWIITFPSLFSWVTPFVYIGFVWAVITRSKFISAAIDRQLVIGFLIFNALGIIVLSINTIYFADLSPWTYWIAGYATWFVFLMLLRSINDPATMVHYAIVIAGFIAGIGNLIYILLFLSGLATDPISFPGYQAYFGIDDRGFFAFSTSHLPLLGFLVPYFTYKASRATEGLHNSEKLLLIILVISGILSLRTSIWIIFFVSLLYFCFTTKNMMFFIKTIVSIFIFMVMLAICFGFNYESLSAIYELKINAKISGEDVRYNQIKFWIKSFLESPLIGHGLTSVETTIYDIATGDLLVDKPGPVVSDYGYEFFYGKLLSDIGLIFLFYVILFAKLTFFADTSSSLQWQVRALRFSALFMLFQSATNSYFQTSGWLFVLMLPMVFLTSCNMQSSDSVTKAYIK